VEELEDRPELQHVVSITVFFFCPFNGTLEQSIFQYWWENFSSISFALMLPIGGLITNNTLKLLKCGICCESRIGINCITST
jgi:hypothetical protein